MSNLINFALQVIGQNPNIAANPNAKAMIDVIRSGDSQKGQEIARNICSSYGVKPEDAVNQAKSFFHL